MKKTLYLLLIVIPLIFGMSSCSDDDNKDREIYELTFEKNDYTVMNNFSRAIMIRGGNGHYTITTENAEIVEATYNPPINVGFGDIIVKGKKKGTTTLSIKDDITGETVKLNITVTDKYLNFSCENYELTVTGAQDYTTIVREDMDRNSPMKGGYLLSLINNADKTLYIFKTTDDASEGGYLYKGEYEFIKGDETTPPHLKIYYTDNNVDKSMTYSMEGSSAIAIINSFMELGWSKSKSTEPAPLYLKLTGDYTAYYQQSYPSLIKATISMTTRIHSFYTVELPVGLVK